MDLMNIRRRIMLNEKKHSRIPDEYQEVEYIGGTTGGEYIDTGIYPHLADGVQIKFQYVSGNVYDYRPFGAYGNGVAIDSYTGLRVWTQSNYNIKPVIPITDGNVHTVICLEDGTWKYDNDIVLTNKKVQEQLKVTLILFKARYSNGINYGTGTSRIYDFQYSRNGIAICSLVPCYRKADNEVGMYDMASRQFLVNAGTGTFLKGADV